MEIDLRLDNRPELRYHRNDRYCHGSGILIAMNAMPSKGCSAFAELLPQMALALRVNTKRGPDVWREQGARIAG